MQNNPLLNQLAFDIVKDKVIEDKTKMYMEEQEKKQKEEIEKQKNEIDDLDEIDSEEERIMQQEMEKMRKTAESKREDMAKKVKTEKSIGRISGEVIAECPPGIAILLPGEIITKEHLPYLTDYEEIEVIKE